MPRRRSSPTSLTHRGGGRGRRRAGHRWLGATEVGQFAGRLHSSGLVALRIEPTDHLRHVGDGGRCEQPTGFFPGYCRSVWRTGISRRNRGARYDVQSVASASPAGSTVLKRTQEDMQSLISELDGMAECTGGEGSSSNLGVSACLVAKKTKPTCVTHKDKVSSMLCPSLTSSDGPLTIVAFCHDQVSVHTCTLCILYISSRNTKFLKCFKFWIVLCSNQHLALRRVWRRDIVRTRLLSSLAFSLCFGGWAGPVSVLCVGMCLPCIVGVIMCGCIGV